VEFLSEALFGADRATFWHRWLKQSDAQRSAPPPLAA